jgi:hypothetical protein
MVKDIKKILFFNVNVTFKYKIDSN